MENIIEVKNLYVKLGNREILKDINFEIKKGESVVIIGPSGCGKTVLIKTILGIIKPVKGEIYIFGQNILKLEEEEIKKIRSKIGMVFQNSALFDSLKVWENVGFYYLYHSEKTQSEIKELSLAILKKLGFDESVIDMMPEQLSGGMKKRVSIARALISNPEIIFYDEPTTGLDPITSESLTELIKNIHNDFNTTDITVTHDVKLASRIGKRLILIDEGKIIESGTYEELKKKSNHPLIKSYVEIGG
ncbi:MAG: ATP-binding cassette domain-containing protein [Candidatus Omnitrophica bacterium]|nr:ATP-binding cassette domain-containing protein [Candidatus Omnitrophota bacterium]MCM8806535.1 ATP-binding cassette domain-containing protein [Candidatus Omnitrophota bacterium]